MPKGGTVTFLLAPYFTGEVGTYTFEFKAYRTDIVLSAENEPDELLKVFPVPATDQFTVWSAQEESPRWLSLTNMNGQEVWREATPGEETRVRTEAFAPGLYILQAGYSNQSTRRRKIMILGR